MFHLFTFSQDGVHYVKTSEIQLRVDCVGNDIFALHMIKNSSHSTLDGCSPEVHIIIL